MRMINNAFGTGSTWERPIPMRMIIRARVYKQLPPPRAQRTPRIYPQMPQSYTDDRFKNIYGPFLQNGMRVGTTDLWLKPQAELCSLPSAQDFEFTARTAAPGSPAFQCG